jgi:uncharacterized Zn-finger protein
VNSEERYRLLREVELAGNCSHPIRLSGEMVNQATGEISINSLRIACKDRRHVVCPSCSYTYKADAWILVSSGLIGGKGTPKEVGGHPRLFITMTAPSFGAVHTITSRGNCVTSTLARSSHSREHTCEHGRLRSCQARHAEEGPELGRPLCEQCFDYERAVLWNAHASKLWNNTIQTIRRSLAEAGGLRQKHLKSVAQIHYLKVAELQRRGLVHFHVILRADGPDDIAEPAPAWLSTELLQHVIRQSVRSTSATGVGETVYRWGQRLDVQDLGEEVQDANAVASYIAKYVTKTTDGSSELAHRFKSRRQIQILVDDPHARRLALTSWALDLRPELQSLRLRRHAHTFGFTGQLITKSRAYSTTFRNLRSVRAQYMASQNGADPVEGTFQYRGRGYDDPKAAELAGLFFRMQRELRVERAQARRSSSLAPIEGTP